MSEFDFVGAYAEEEERNTTLPDNEAPSSLNIAFVGVGGGGCKVASAFIEQGFHKTLLINTTHKDFPTGIDEAHLIALPELDGVAKNVELGKKVLLSNAAIIEDALRVGFGKVDWLVVCASGGGGTGSSAAMLSDTFDRYLSSVEAEGGVVWVITRPTAQEMLNPTIKSNFESLLQDVEEKTYILLDNERQLNRLRGKVGLSQLYPSANTMFSKMIAQVLKLTDTESAVSACDGKDLSRFLSEPGGIMLGTAMLEPSSTLGSDLYQSCVKASPCPEPTGRAKVGLLLEILSETLANDPDVGLHIEAAASYVGGRSDTLFSGVYIYEMPEDLKDHLVSILALGGL